MKNRNAKRPFIVVLPALLAGLASLALAGCASPDANWVHENLSLTENFHAGTKVLVTPVIPDTGAHQARLRATARTRGKRIGAEIELAVRAEFDDFSFLDRASFASGRAFPLTVVKRVTEDCGTTDKSLCNVHEHVTIKLSRKYLLSKRTSGFDVKLWGRRDSVMLFVPAYYIEGLLARMENRPPDSNLQAGARSERSGGAHPGPASPAHGGATKR